MPGGSDEHVDATDSDAQRDDDPTAPDEAPAEPTAPASRAVEVICRDSLGLAAASGGALPHTITRLTLHHTGVELGSNRYAPGRLRGHQRFHQESGWADIAYHFGVDAGGNIYELRAVEHAGDTFTAYDPAGHFLVVCEGNYDLEQPTDAMLQGVAEILAFGARQYEVAPATLTGHRDHAGTSCPGESLYGQLDAISEEVARLAAEPLERRTLCGADGDERIGAIEQG